MSQQKIDSLVHGGAVLYLRLRPGERFLTVLVATAKVKDQQLFWISLFPEDQHHAHVLDFDRMKENNSSIMFYKGGELVACLSDHRTQPQLDSFMRNFFTCEPLNAESLERSFQEWKQHLEEGDNAAEFKSFAKAMEEELLEP